MPSYHKRDNLLTINEVYMILSSFCKYYLLLAILLINSAQGAHPRPHYHNSNSPTVVETVAAVGIVAAVAYGFYKLCDWLFTKTDEQVLQESRQCWSTAHDNTKRYVDALKAGVGEFPESRKEQQKMIKQVDEDFLYHCAVKKIYTNAHTLSGYAQQVADAGLASSKRAADLRKKHSHLPIISKLENISNELGVLHNEIVFAAEFMREHETYFDIFELETCQLVAYEFELSSLDYHANNPLYLREALRMAVMKKAAHERVNYPYMKYVEDLERELKTLKHHIERLGYAYQNRNKGAHLLLQRLDAVYNIVVSEDAYRQELRDYKKEMLERERIAAEQAKAQAAAAQAHAAHLQAQALQQQAYQMQQQNQLQQQQNAILASQAHKPAHVNVYL